MGPGRYRRVRYLHVPCGVSPPNSRRYDAGAAHDVHSRPPGICLEGCPPPRAPSVAALRACSQRRVSLESGVGPRRNTGAPMGVLHPRVLPPATPSPRDWVLAMSIFVPLHLHLAHLAHRTAPHHHHATPDGTLLPVTRILDTPHTKPGAAPDGLIEAGRLRATINASFSRLGHRWSPPATPPTVGPRRCCAPRLACPPTGFHGSPLPVHHCHCSAVRRDTLPDPLADSLHTSGVGRHTHGWGCPYSSGETQTETCTKGQ